MTLSLDQFVKQARANLEAKRLEWTRLQPNSQEPPNRVIQELQAELDAKEKLLKETLHQLQEEKDRGLQLTYQLSEIQAKLQEINLRLVPNPKLSSSTEYPSLGDDLVNAPSPHKRLKICIVTQDILGPVRNGGIGTAFYYVANFLKNCGHDVTIFYSLGNYCESGNIDDWIVDYANLGINFVPAAEPTIPSARGSVGRAMSTARKVYEYLKSESFDIVHASEWKGNVFYALLAKKLGMAFANTTFCIKTSSPGLWSTMGNNVLVDEPQNLLQSYIERKSVEWGDIIISPSLHMLRWMENHGYELPKERCYVQPNIMPISDSCTTASHEGQSSAYLDNVKELVFFGRLEPRKGIQVFCQALSKLEDKRSTPFKVVFLGKFNPARFDAESYIQTHSKAWSFEWEIIQDYNALEALNYLRTNNRLAVIPSLLDNSPFTIYECLSEKIPFLCSDRGGTPELVDVRDRDEVVVPAHPTKLARRLQEVLDRGIKIARPAFDFKENLDIWKKWHLAIGHNPNLRLEATEAGQKVLLSSKLEIPKEKPLVSVCLAHFNRPNELSQAVKSLETQTYDRYEVIVVDDGSDQPEAIAYLNSLEDRFLARGWKIVRQENLYLGAVRNTGVRHARGEYILFMDDDNYAKPHELETFVAAAQYSGADILTCFADRFEGEEEPSLASVTDRLTPIGDCLSYGLLENCYGDSNSLVKRSFFDNIEGFSEDYGVGLDDMEFFSRAILKGGKLFVVPEALYWYRISKSRLRNFHFDFKAGHWRVLKPYIENLPWVTHDLLRLSVGLFSSSQQTKIKISHLRHWIHKVSQDFDRVNSLVEQQIEKEK